MGKQNCPSKKRLLDKIVIVKIYLFKEVFNNNEETIIPIERICKQATYLQMNDTHTTHWSVQYSVYMGTSYMRIEVVLEFMSIKDFHIATASDKFKGR